MRGLTHLLDDTFEFKYHGFTIRQLLHHEAEGGGIYHHLLLITNRDGLSSLTELDGLTVATWRFAISTKGPGEGGGPLTAKLGRPSKETNY